MAGCQEDSLHRCQEDGDWLALRLCSLAMRDGLQGQLVAVTTTRDERMLHHHC